MIFVKSILLLKKVIEGDFWDPDREKAEWFNRQNVLMEAQQDAGPDDWFVYFDADEHPYNFQSFLNYLICRT